MCCRSARCAVRYETLARLDALDWRLRQTDSAEARFLLGAGNSGFDAATNEVVARSNHEMLLLVYAAVGAICVLTFRSWRATLCALLPLMLTSVLGEALMVGLGIGVKVATLPVIALGVGIGVDYALYIMSMLLAELRRGATLADAYATALRLTGRVVLFTGATLAIGVATWAFSPIKFQADMGVLLAFMFVLNMVGSLVLLPALAHFLLRPVVPGSRSSAAAAAARGVDSGGDARQRVGSPGRRGQSPCVGHSAQAGAAGADAAACRVARSSAASTQESTAWNR